MLTAKNKIFSYIIKKMIRPRSMKIAMKWKNFVSNIRLTTIIPCSSSSAKYHRIKKKNILRLLNFTLFQPFSIRSSTSAVTSNGNRFECQIISIRVLDSWQGRQEERREYGVGGAYRRSDRVKVCSVARYAHKSGYI